MKRMIQILCAVLLTAALLLPAAAAELYLPEGETGLRAPAGLLTQPDGALLVADSERNQILQLQEGQLTVFAGHMLPDTVYGRPAGGYLDGSAVQALFSAPSGLAFWRDGVVVSDTGNHVLRYIVNGTVKTLAGAGSEGLRNGSGKLAKFAYPMGLASDDQGNLYIADSGNGVIRRMTQKGQVTTWADGFEAPAGLCWADGALYMADAGSNRIYKIQNGASQVIAGDSALEDGQWTWGFADGPAAKATFSQPSALIMAGEALYIADTGNSAIRVLRQGRVDTLLQSAGEEALWPAQPAALALAGQTLYCADSFAGLLYGLQTGPVTYADLPETDPAHSAVLEICDRGLMVGVGAGRFDPEGKLTRAMLATVLQRLEQSRDRDAILAADASCADLPAGQWYTGPCAWALEAGLMEPEAGGRFAPNLPLTRAQCRDILDRYAGYLGAEAVAWTHSGPDSILTRSGLCILLQQFLQTAER